MAVALNIIFLGESGVGKTTLLKRFVDKEFVPRRKMTVLDIKSCTMTVCGRDVTLNIWDTGGQERYHSIGQSYYNKSDGVILVYDVTAPETYYALSTWIKDLRKINATAPCIIVGNKIDEPNKSVTLKMVKNFAAEHGMEFIETSAFTGENVDQAFITLSHKILVAKGLIEVIPEPPPPKRAPEPEVPVPDSKTEPTVRVITDNNKTEVICMNLPPIVPLPADIIHLKVNLLVCVEPDEIIRLDVEPPTPEKTGSRC